MADGRVFAGSFWPSEQQKCLLRAALLNDERGIAAWQAVRRDFDLQKIEKGSVVLLPLLYEKLVERSATEAFVPRLKGLRRYMWYENQVGIEALQHMVGTLCDGGVETIVLGDAALIIRYYGRLGVRPLNEPAVLVRPRQVGLALDALTSAGWRLGRTRSGRHRSLERCWAGQQRTCSTHWRLPIELEPATDTQSSESVWNAKETLDIGGVQSATLSATHELLRTCVAGARGASPRVQWIADVVAILQNSAAEIDWERLYEEAVTYHCVLRLRDALGYVADTLDAPVPRSVLDRLYATPSTPRERLAHRISGRGAIFGSLPATVSAHLVATQERSILRSALGLPRLFLEEWDLDHFGQLPAVTLRKGVSAISAARTTRHTPR